MIFKRQLAHGIRRIALLRWGIRLAVRLFVPQHYVGAVGVVFNEIGQVLIVEHVFRAHYPWGLPGGWVERWEDPAEAVRREFKEELNIDIEVKRLLLCRPQGNAFKDNAPPGLSLAYYCRLVDEAAALKNLAEADNAYEILMIRWLRPENIPYKITPFQQEAIRLAQQIFDSERLGQVA